MSAAAKKQHLIDPEICIRCNTCEETCPIDAITHNDDNYVVNFDTCNMCMACISPCPTGAIDNWRVVTDPYSIDDQFDWDELPEQMDIPAPSNDAGAEHSDAFEAEIQRLFDEAHQGVGIKVPAPASAAKPATRLFKAADPAKAVVQGNYRLTDENAENDVRHIILNFGDQTFPTLEGQSVGIIPPGTDAEGKPHAPRLYSIASPRDGEKPGTNNIALTVKREPDGVCSNFLCDLPKGATVDVTGPFGSTFLMPEDPQAHIIMVCTGTGSAPFRGFTMRRQRAQADATGGMILYFGARRPEELPYFGPLKKIPESLLHQELVYSRMDGQPKEYVQDRIATQGDRLAPLLRDPNTYIYVCGLKGMEDGVDSALTDICAAHGMDWTGLRQTMCVEGRFHVETY